MAERDEAPGSRKDRLIQTRVATKLETTLKEEARKRRTTVSQMIRNILEDTFDLVDDVVANVDVIVSDSVDLAQEVGRAARGRRRGKAARRRCNPLPEAEERLSHVQAWNEVVLNRAATCTRCGAELAKGSTAFLGVSSDPSAPTAWLCPAGVGALGDDEDEDEEPSGG